MTAKVALIALMTWTAAVNSPTATSAASRGAHDPISGADPEVRALSYYRQPAAETEPAADSGPTIGPITVQTPGTIEKYSKFAVSFRIKDTTATNVYFPYDENTPAGVETGTGISVDAFLLPPGETNWSNAKTLPCFYYQPVEEVGTGDHVALLPAGEAEWRCRFSPEKTGTWRYKIRATDAGGTTESPEHSFDCHDCGGDACKGFVRVSQTDSRFFEYANGEPFVTPLLSMEQGSPFNSLAEIRTTVPRLGKNGARFIRWFPTGEGANYFVAPYGDTMRINWRFGDAWMTFDGVDSEAGKSSSFRPYYYSTQRIPVEPGQYRLSFRGKAEDERVMRMQVGKSSADVCSSSSTHHEANASICDYKQDGWNDYSLEVTVSKDTTLAVGVRGLYVSTDGPAPYNTVENGQIRVHSMRFERFEEDRGEWGANLLTRSDPDTHTYVDQRSAAKLDEILRLSEDYGVYHKLTMFHKNGAILNRMQPDGTLGSYDHSNASFYSEDGLASRWYQRAYARYFIARWSYSTALHSLEIANETNPWEEASQDAGLSLARYVHDNAPRHVLMSDSFWHSFPNTFWSDPAMDYADKHWYARSDSGDWDLVSTTYDDSAAYVRECWRRFRQYQGNLSSTKPIVRGEGGVWPAGGGWGQHPDVPLDPEGTWYHKKLWAHVGVLGYTCDGEWYPRTFVTYEEGQFPNSEHDLFKMYAGYEAFIRNEPFSNGQYEEIGNDLDAHQQILVSESTGNLRVWGTRDSAQGKALLWIDNSEHTWKNVVDGAAIPPVGATLTIQGLPPGPYTAQWWDTRSGEITGIDTEGYVVDDTGDLSFVVENLRTDRAVKFIREGELVPSLLSLDVSPHSADHGEHVTSTIVIQNASPVVAKTAHLTNTLPDGLSYVSGSMTASTGVVTDSAAPALYWSGVLGAHAAVTITHAAVVSTLERKPVVNTVELSEAGGERSTATSTVMTNPAFIYLPLVLETSP